MIKQIELSPDESEALAGYFEAFDFADCGEDGQPPQDAEISEEAQRIAACEVIAFIARYRPYLEALDVTPEWAQVGRDIYFTRRGHGVGFWDKPEVYGTYADMLTKGAQALGNVEYYQGDDGLVYA